MRLPESPNPRYACKDNPACGSAGRRSGRQMNFDLFNIKQRHGAGARLPDAVHRARALFRGRGAASLRTRAARFRWRASSPPCPPRCFLLIAPLLAVPPLLAAVIAVGISIAVCGALHEDGLADTADGFFGGKDAAQRLDIMKDLRNGTYGTLALVLSVCIRVAALSSIAVAQRLRRRHGASCRRRRRPRGSGLALVRTALGPPRRHGGSGREA